MPLETARELVDRVHRAGDGDHVDSYFEHRLLVQAVEADRAAVARAARLQLLDEMQAALGKYYEHAVGPALNELAALKAKYGSSKEPG